MVQLGALVDGFGVGTAVAYPPGVDFSAKIVAVKEKGKWQYRGKRGGLGGRKAVFRSKGYRDLVTLEGKDIPGEHQELLKPIIRNGKMTSRFKGIEELRSQTVREIKAVAQAEPSLSWR
jgi:nicotinate phosphoribosyltransferase